MSESHVKVNYSAKNVIIIAVLCIFFIAMDAFLMIMKPNSFMNIVMIGLNIFLTIYLIYLALNRIKEISFCDDKILIDRFLLSSLTFEGKNIKFISKDILKIGNKTFNLRFVLNKSELITLLLNAMEIKNIDEAINGILDGVHLYKNEEEINEAVKKTNITAIILTILMGLSFIAIIILNHWGIIFIVCTVILIGLSYLKDFLFEERLNKINSRLLRMILNGCIYLACIALTIVLGVIIYKIFKVYNIDLLKITV